MKLTNMLLKMCVLFCYGALFSLATYFGKLVSYQDLILFMIGLVFGTALLEIDENFLFKFYYNKNQNKNLATRSFLFLISLFPLGLFLMTSTGSALGVGMLLSIVSMISLELHMMRNDLIGFQKRFFYQLKRNLTIQEQKIFTNVFILLTLVYAFLVIFLGR